MTESTLTPVSGSEAKNPTAQNCSKLLTENREFGEKPDDSGLSAIQWAALELMLGGTRDVAITRELHVCRRTLYSWRVENQEFKEELLRQRRLQFRRQMDRTRSLTDEALTTLEEQVQNPYEPTSHRAARTLLSLTKVGLAVYEESAPKAEESET